MSKAQQISGPSPEIVKLYESRVAARDAAHGRGADGRGASTVRSNAAPKHFSIEELADLIKNFDPSCGYDEWIEAGMCLHHETEGSDEGLALWDEWSSAGDNYGSSDDCAYHWYSFRRTVNAKTIATLLKRASQKGVKIAGPRATADDFDEMPPEENTAGETDAGLQRPQGQDKKVGRFTPIPAGEYANRPDALHLIEDVIVQGDLVSLFGPSGGGKSFVAIDIGMAIARGVPWNGKETQQATVVYICCEGQGSFNKRLRAYSRAKDVDLDTVPFLVIPESLNLLDQKEVESLLSDIQEGKWRTS